MLRYYFSQLDHIDVFSPKKNIFAMECLAHVISGECKAGVVDVQSEDGFPDTQITR